MTLVNVNGPHFTYPPPSVRSFRRSFNYKIKSNLIDREGFVEPLTLTYIRRSFYNILINITLYENIQDMFKVGVLINLPEQS